MSRAVLILANDSVRARAARWISIAPPGTRLEFKGPKRTLPQNALLHAMLTDVAEQMTHNGRRMGIERWKRLFMDALNAELDCELSLDGKRMVPIGRSTADLSVEEMGALVEVIYAWGATHGVTFHDGQGPGEGQPRSVAA